MAWSSRSSTRIMVRASSAGSATGQRRPWPGALYERVTSRASISTRSLQCRAARSVASTPTSLLARQHPLRLRSRGRRPRAVRRSDRPRPLDAHALPSRCAELPVTVRERPPAGSGRSRSSWAGRSRPAPGQLELHMPASVSVSCWTAGPRMIWPSSRQLEPGGAEGADEVADLRPSAALEQQYRRRRARWRGGRGPPRTAAHVEHLQLGQSGENVLAPARRASSSTMPAGSALAGREHGVATRRVPRRPRTSVTFCLPMRVGFHREILG